MPDPLEFPGMLGPVIPLMRPRDAVVNEFVTLTFRHAALALKLLRTAARRLPGFATVIRTLNDLAEPTACLRRVNPVRIDRRTFHVINLPARKVRPLHFPIFPLRIRSQDESSFTGADQYSYRVHCVCSFFAITAVNS